MFPSSSAALAQTLRTYRRGPFDDISNKLVIAQNEFLRTTPLSSPNGSTTAWGSLAYGAGLFVALGAATNNGNYYTSPDGITWTLRTLAQPLLANGIIFANSQFVAVGQGSNAATSPDGITWTSRTLATGATWLGLAYGGSSNLYVAVGTSTCNTSPDGVTWTLRAGPSSMTSLAFGNSIFVTGVQNNNVNYFTSADGITWTARASMPLGQWANAPIVFGNGAFFVLGKDGMLATSTDGLTWTTRGFVSSLIAGVNYAWTSLVWTGRMFIATHALGTFCATSPDGVTWTVRPMSPALIVSLAAANNTVVGVGGTGGVGPYGVVLNTSYGAVTCE